MLKTKFFHHLYMRRSWLISRGSAKSLPKGSQGAIVVKIKDAGVRHVRVKLGPINVIISASLSLHLYLSTKKRTLKTTNEKMHAPYWLNNLDNISNLIGLLMLFNVWKGLEATQWEKDRQMEKTGVLSSWTAQNFQFPWRLLFSEKLLWAHEQTFRNGNKWKQ